MDKETFRNIINKYENERTKSAIGKIDTEFITLEDFQVVYYAFPLIEKMVIEIFKLLPDSNVEVYEQGQMKTIMATIEENNKEYIIPKETEALISLYFKDDCLRNSIFHQSDVEKINVNITYLQDIRKIIADLLKILNELLEKYSYFDFKDIEYLKS